MLVDNDDDEIPPPRAGALSPGDMGEAHSCRYGRRRVLDTAREGEVVGT